MKILLCLGILNIFNGIPLISSGSPPIISEHPLDILVAKGDPATLRCETSGENVEITWYKDSELVKVGNGHRLLLPNGSLFLLKVNNGGTDSDAGTYYCVARNKFGEARSQEANVRVAMLRDDFRINPHAIQALIGSRVTLECAPPKGFPEPIVVWVKDERELDTQESIKYHLTPEGNLIIENAQRSDAGFYQCVANNMVGKRISKPARLSVYEKPRFMIEPKNTVADVNSSVHFECKVIGEPLPSISWKKRDGQMPIGRAYVARDRGGLRIDRVQPEDAGEYVCLAKNPVGSVESTAQLRVNAPPIFTKLPQNLRLNSGKTGVFECEAIGQPMPGIFWSKEGDQLFTFFSGLVSSDGRIQVTNEGRLIIESVRHFDQGNYICAAVNSAGSTLSKASLTVVTDATSSYPPPIIQYGHQNQTLMLNDMAILPCQATGRSKFTIAWLKNGVELQLNGSDLEGRYRQLPVGTLQISDLKRSDTGIYTCRVRNEDGEATWTASLVVEGHTNKDIIFQRMPDAAALPSSPGQPHILNVTEDTIDMEWTVPERHGASPIIGYIIQYWSPKMGEIWQNVLDVVPKTRFQVKHLQPAHSYVFIIRAENSEGIGLPSMASDMVNTKQSNSGLGKNSERDQRMSRMLDLENARQRLASEQLVKLLEVKPLNATAILLSWKRQRKEALVQGYYIKWRGPPLGQDHSWVNITDSEIDHVIINGLRPFNNYEFFVIPYHQQIQGMPSNSLDGTTAEAPPTMPPSDVRLRMLNITSLRVSWRPPPSDHINGILKGFLINIRSNHSSVEDRNITTNERATSVTLYRLIPNASYAIRVAARTNAGVGVFFNGEPVVMNDETLRRHIRLFDRTDNAWYKQPWAVLGCGIVLWCLLLFIIVLTWYRCCHRNHLNDEGKKEREFIKIRDGSVCAPNTTILNDERNAFWTAHEQYNGGTVETSSGTLARPNQHHMCYQQNFSSDFDWTTCNGNATLGNNGRVQLNQHQHPLHCSTTLQRINENCQINHSPSHHYHYAHMPIAKFVGAESGPLSTFLQHRPPPQYYDDPSPYATTTLVNPPGTIGKSNNLGPTLPTKPAPKEPPTNFLSSEAVMRPVNNSSDRTSSNSCGALLELNPEQQRITAVSFKQQRRLRNEECQHQANYYDTSGRRAKDNGTKRNNRSSSATISNRQHHTGSYVQSMNGMNKASIIKTDGYCASEFNVEAPLYDPVMTESIHQMMQENVKKRKGKKHDKKSRTDIRSVSLIEDEEQAEHDPLMENATDEDEADGEMSEQSDEYVSNTNGSGDIQRKTKHKGEKEHYYGYSPASNRPTRQPMMGVNVSTLTVGESFAREFPRSETERQCPNGV